MKLIVKIAISLSLLFSFSINTGCSGGLGNLGKSMALSVLTETISSQYNIDNQTSKTVVGVVFLFLQNKLTANEFSAIQQAVPSISSYMETAKLATGLINDPTNLQTIYPVLQQLGVKLEGGTFPFALRNGITFFLDQTVGGDIASKVGSILTAI